MSRNYTNTNTQRATANSRSRHYTNKPEGIYVCRVLDYKYDSTANGNDKLVITAEGWQGALSDEPDVLNFKVSLVESETADFISQFFIGLIQSGQCPAMEEEEMLDYFVPEKGGHIFTARYWWDNYGDHLKPYLEE